MNEPAHTLPSVDVHDDWTLGAPVEPPVWSVGGRLASVIVLAAVLWLPLSFTAGRELETRVHKTAQHGLLLFEIGRPGYDFAASSARWDGLWLWWLVLVVAAGTLAWERVALGVAWRRHRSIGKTGAVARFVALAAVTVPAVAVTFVRDDPRLAPALGAMLALIAATVAAALAAFEAIESDARGWIRAGGARASEVVELAGFDG